jgi:NmrA-like family
MVEKVLVIGATGAQGTPVVRELAKDGRYEVVIFTRNAASERSKALLARPLVTAFEGDTTREKDLYDAFRRVDRVYANLDGFVIGEIQETYWGIRMFEIAVELGIEHYVWGSLDYLVKKGGFDSKYRCGHYDAKGRVGELILQQKPKSMAVSVLTSGPYMEMIYEGMFAPHTLADGSLLFAHPMGNGKVPMIHLDDLGRYARWIFDHREESSGLDLEIATQHVGWPYLVDCVRRVTGMKAVFKDVDQAEYFEKYSGRSPTEPASWAQAKHGPALGGQTFWENFAGWWSAWHDNLVKRDYALLDRILPDRVRDLEEWMHKTKYDGRPRSVIKDRSDRRDATK